MRMHLYEVTDAKHLQKLLKMLVNVYNYKLNKAQITKEYLKGLQKGKTNLVIHSSEVCFVNDLEYLELINELHNKANNI